MSFYVCYKLDQTLGAIPIKPIIQCALQLTRGTERTFLPAEHAHPAALVSARVNQPSLLPGVVRQLTAWTHVRGRG